MPFRKPQQPTFRVVTLGSCENEESLWTLFHSAARCRPTHGSYVEEGHPEKFIVETKLPHLRTVRLEFINPRLKDLQKLPASMYYHPMHFFVTIRDFVELLPVNSEMNVMPMKAIQLFGVEPGDHVTGDVIKDVIEKRLGTCLKCDVITKDVIKRVIQIIRNFLVIHRSGELQSFKEEMSAVNLILHDKTTLNNSTMCYERNSIG